MSSEVAFWQLSSLVVLSCSLYVLAACLLRFRSGAGITLQERYLACLVLELRRCSASEPTRATSARSSLHADALLTQRSKADVQKCDT